MKKSKLPFVFMLFLLFSVKAQKNRSEVLKNLDAKKDTYTSIAQDIWDFAEMGYLEEGELVERRGKDFVYVPLLGERAPALDYRK